MKVFALVGKSGTGKSYQAVNLCKEKNIEGIIDDGLFIVGSGIAAGVSAKRQNTKIGAVKTALFADEWHKISVKEKIRDVSPESLLIIGTSDEMVTKIARRLDLPPILEIVHIDSITTEHERAAAIKQRHDQGKHVIPVPTFQIKREFSGYFREPLRIFRGRSKEIRGADAEKSVVRPTYSYLGGYVVSDRVISDIVDCVLKSGNGDIIVTRVFTENYGNGIKIKILAVVRYGAKIIEAAKTFQEQVAYRVGDMTAFNVDCVDIEVRDLI